MAVTVDIALAGPFHPNGVTVEFDFSFKAASTSEIKVFRQATDGSLTTINAALYSVTLATDGEGGSVVFSAPPATAGGSLYIEGNPAFTQEAIFTNNGFLPVTINPAIDRSALRDIWLRDRIGRAVSVPFGEIGLTLPRSADRANDILGFDAAGLPATYPQSTFKGAQGDPGGNVMAIGAWSGFEGMNIPVGVDLVQTSDTLTAGSTTGTASARYKLDPSQAAYPPALDAWMQASQAAPYGTDLAVVTASADAFMRFWRRKSANGRWFTLAEPEPWTGQFGCPGDGSMSVTTKAYNDPVNPGLITWTNGGTDVFQNFQNFIDYCVFIAKCQGRIGPGTHRVSRGLQHGYGNTYVGGVFRGAGQAYAGGSAFAGSTIICDTDEDPILNIAADRSVLWQGVSFRGPYDTWILNTTIGYPSSDPRSTLVGGNAHASYANYDALDATSWIANYIRPSQVSRYNPMCAVTLGAYDGARPSAGTWTASAAYLYGDSVRANGGVYSCIVAGSAAGSGGPSGTGPFVTDGTVKWIYVGAEDLTDLAKFVCYREPYRPGWMINPAQSAYNNSRYGSFATFRDCFFSGFPVLVGCKPCPNALQNDFLAFDRCNFVNYNWGVSIGNNQMRNFMLNGCNFGIGNCSLTNYIHGNRTGSFKASHINDCGFGASVDVFKMNSSYGEPTVFTGCYCEGQFKLGQVIGGGRANMGPVFIGCEWNLSGVNAIRGRAPRHFYGANDGSSLVNEAVPVSALIPSTFLNCKINVDSVFTCYMGGTGFINTQIYNYDRGAATVSPYLAQADNAMVGGLVMPGLDYSAGEFRLFADVHDADAGTYGGHIATGPGYRFGYRGLGIPWCVRSVAAKTGTSYEELVVPHESGQLLAKGSYAITWTDGAGTPPEMKIVLPGFTQADHADTRGYGPGSVIIDGLTGMVMAVRSFDPAAAGGPTLIAVALNNFKLIAGVYTWLQTPVSTGSFIFRHARLYTPDLPLYGDFVANVTATGTNGSPNLTSVSGALTPGQVLTHANIPAGTTVQSVQGTTAIMTANATGAVSGSITVPTTVANVGDTAGVGTTIQTLIPVGDYLQSPPQLRSYTPVVTTVSARANGSPGSITLGQNAVRSGANVRLGFFRRPCPANV